MKTNDIFLYWTVTVFVLAVTAGMYLKHIDYWFIGATIAFLLIGYYFDVAEQESNRNYFEDRGYPLDWEDYKAQYEAPDEYNMDGCDTCHNKVYKLCMCKPVVKN